MIKPEEKIAKLNEIYLHDMDAVAPDAAASFLAAMLWDADYLVRSKAFLTAAYFPGLPPLIEATAEVLIQEEREWQLRAMEVWRHWALPSLLPCLRPYLFQRQRPLLIRGALLTAAEIGGIEALALIYDFLSSPYCGYLKEDFIGACLQRGIGRTAKGLEAWNRICREDAAVAGFAMAVMAKGEDNSLLTVYPYPDYLSRQAEARGFSAAAWKQATYFPRRKKKRQE